MAVCTRVEVFGGVRFYGLENNDDVQFTVNPTILFVNNKLHKRARH